MGALKGQAKMSSGVNGGNECTLCNGVCVCVRVGECVRKWACIHPRVYVYVSPLFAWKHMCETAEGWIGIKVRPPSELSGSSSPSSLSLFFRVFIVMFRSSSSNSAPFCSQVHVCQWLLLSLSSLNVLDQICSLSLYLLFYFKFISFYQQFPFYVLSVSHVEIDQILITKGVPGFCKGFLSAWMLYRCKGRIWTYYRRQQKFLNHCILYKRLCDCTDLSLSLLLSFCCCWPASFRTKTSCMIQQCFQNCCIYPLWILCDCTVLYLSITGNYTVLYVCQGPHTHSHRESLINSPIL